MDRRNRRSEGRDQDHQRELNTGQAAQPINSDQLDGGQSTRKREHTMNPMQAMPKMPSAKKNKPSRECACGCQGLTKSIWVSGHDGRATGWAIRVERGVMTIDDVPENERPGAIHMIEKRGIIDTPKAGPTKAERRAAAREAKRIAAAGWEKIEGGDERTGTEG